MRIRLTKNVWNGMDYPEGTLGEYVNPLNPDSDAHEVELQDSMGLWHPAIVWDDEFRYVPERVW